MSDRQRMERSDQYYMARAIRLAEKGRYSTHPNPRVGCVLVHNQVIVGEGWHRRAGEGHAEVNALAQAGRAAAGSTAYVTLEPCSHFGRTPPCADGLIKAGVARVVIGMEDPNPQVSGRGIQKLLDAGISVTCGVLEAQAKALNPGFIKRMAHGLPFVRVKLASSLDGRTAMASGESKWITGAAARSDVQRLRARSSAVLTAVESVIADNSRLTLRAEELGLESEQQALALSRPPLRILLDRTLQVPHSAAILQPDSELLIVTAQSELPKHLLQPHISVLQISERDGHLDLAELLARLATDYQINELLVETGARLAGAFMQQNLVDELVVYMAPMLMGSSARPLLNWPIDQMADAQRWRWVDQRVLGQDLRLTLQAGEG